MVISVYAKGDNYAILCDKIGIFGDFLSFGRLVLEMGAKYSSKDVRKYLI